MAVECNGWTSDEFIQLVRSQIQKIIKILYSVGETWDVCRIKLVIQKDEDIYKGKKYVAIALSFKRSLINFTKGYIKSDRLKQRIMSLYENYPRESFCGNINIVGTSETERILSVVDENIELLKLLLVIQFTLPGVPLIYYGDEAGLTGGKEPDNRKSYPWGKENGELINFYHKITSIRITKWFKKGGFKYL